MSGPEVTVEVIHLRSEAARWCFRRTTEPLERWSDPSRLARKLAGDPLLLHSTSWRHDPEQGVILTFAAYPDTDPEQPAHPLDDLALVFGERPDAPRPPHVAPHHVAAHAIRHLAFLSLTDPVVGAAIAGEPALEQLLDGVPSALAGGLG